MNAQPPHTPTPGLAGAQTPVSPLLHPDTTTDPLLTFLFSLLGQVVILDTQGPLLYIGTLRQISPLFLLLDNADVHDSNDSRATKDLYLAETRDLGVRPNRTSVLIARPQIASISLLSDVQT